MCIVQVGAAPLVEFLTAHVPQEVAAASAEGWKRERTEAALAAARYMRLCGGEVSHACLAWAGSRGRGSGISIREGRRVGQPRAALGLVVNRRVSLMLRAFTAGRVEGALWSAEGWKRERTEQH